MSTNVLHDEILISTKNNVEKWSWREDASNQTVTDESGVFNESSISMDEVSNDKSVSFDQSKVTPHNDSHFQDDFILVLSSFLYIYMVQVGLTEPQPASSVAGNQSTLAVSSDI